MRNQAKNQPLQLLWRPIFGKTPQPFHSLQVKQSGVRTPPLELGAHQQELAVGPLQGDPEEQIDSGAIPERGDIPQNGLGADGKTIISPGQERGFAGLIHTNTGPEPRKLLFIRP